METIAADNPDGEYENADGSAVTATDLETVEQTLADANITTVTGGTDSYTVTATSETGNTFTIQRANDGTVTYPCTAGGNAGCRIGPGRLTTGVGMKGGPRGPLRRSRGLKWVKPPWGRRKVQGHRQGLSEPASKGLRP